MMNAETFILSAMNGLYLIGHLHTNPTMIDVARLLSGKYKEDITCGLFHNFHGFVAESMDEVYSDIVVMTAYENLCSPFRQALQKILDDEGKRIEDNAKQRFLNADRPHALGTVNDIAQKYNMSKSEVRRHKAAGTLESAIASKVIDN